MMKMKVTSISNSSNNNLLKMIKKGKKMEMTI